MKIIHFYHFDSDRRFPPFLLYVRWKSGVTFVRRCFRDGLVCIMWLETLKTSFHRTRPVCRMDVKEVQTHNILTSTILMPYQKELTK